VALIVYGSDSRSRRKRQNGSKGGYGLVYDPRQASQGPLRVGGPMAFEASYGGGIICSYALAAQRHMYEFGTTSEQLAEIAVATRYNAGFNPSALYRDPITVEDVLNSRMMADPLHQLDCCVVSDAGGAVILTTEERARDLKQQPVHVLAAKSCMTHWQIGQMPSFTTAPVSHVADALFAAAGVTHSDIDVLELYDSFTITVLMQLEGLGFCKKGEGGPFVSDGKLKVGGALPTNTDGGGLSSSHPGMRGIFTIIEAVRQLRGAAGDAQVPDCKLALASGSGGILSSMGATILGKERP